MEAGEKAGSFYERRIFLKSYCSERVGLTVTQVQADCFKPLKWQREILKYKIGKGTKTRNESA